MADAHSAKILTGLGFGGEAREALHRTTKDRVTELEEIQEIFARRPQTTGSSDAQFRRTKELAATNSTEHIDSHSHQFCLQPPFRHMARTNENLSRGRLSRSLEQPHNAFSNTMIEQIAVLLRRRHMMHYRFRFATLGPFPDVNESR